MKTLFKPMKNEFHSGKVGDNYCVAVARVRDIEWVRANHMRVNPVAMKVGKKLYPAMSLMVRIHRPKPSSPKKWCLVHRGRLGDRAALFRSA